MLAQLCKFTGLMGDTYKVQHLAPMELKASSVKHVIIDRIAGSTRTPYYEQVVSKVQALKTLDRHELPKALIELFSVHATFEYMGQSFAGDLSKPGSLDRCFIDSVMGDCFSRLGSGSHSAAFVLDSNWIIKMNCCNYEYSGQDAGFEWAQACIELDGNVFTPKIAALYQKDMEYCMVAERLDENRQTSGTWGSPIYTSPDAGCFLDLAETHYDEMDFGEYVLDMADYPTFVLMAAMNRDHLIQLSKVYQKVSESCKCEDDLEDFNLMVRGRVPVINDPLRDSKSGALALGKSFAWMHQNG